MAEYYSEKAAQLQSSIRESERNDVLEYDEAQVRQAIVHSRQDIVLIVSYIASLNEQMIGVRRLLLIVVILLLAILVWR